MRYLFFVYCIMATTSFASPRSPQEEMAAVLTKVKESPERYAVSLAYIPKGNEGAATPVDLYSAPTFGFKIQALEWQPPVKSLLKILIQTQLSPSKEPGRWAAGIRIEDRTSSVIVFSIEISVPFRVVTINGKGYDADPELINWFRRELLPAVQALNKGSQIKDL